MTTKGYNLYSVKLDRCWLQKGCVACLGFIVCCRTEDNARCVHPTGLSLPLASLRMPANQRGDWPLDAEQIQCYVKVRRIGVADSHVVVSALLTRDNNNPSFNPRNMAVIIMKTYGCA